MFALTVAALLLRKAFPGYKPLTSSGFLLYCTSHIAGGAARLRVLIRDDPWNLIRVVPA
jgi:hypothetical protein